MSGLSRPLGGLFSRSREAGLQFAVDKSISEKPDLC
jgi:hypothetical protein